MLLDDEENVNVCVCVCLLRSRGMPRGGEKEKIVSEKVNRRIQENIYVYADEFPCWVAKPSSSP